MTTPTPSEPVELAEPSEETVERVARALCEVLDSGDEAREHIRVEITREVEIELRRLVSTNNLHLVHDPHHVGPMKIMGVSFYVVHTLPEPGWRVIGAPD